MAEPPAIYVNLVRLEENVDQLLESKSELGTNLLREKRELERLSVPAEVRLRHGIVLDQVFEEVRAGELRFDSDRHLAGARSARSLHHGRSDPQHFKSRHLSRSSWRAPANQRQLELFGTPSKDYLTRTKDGQTTSPCVCCLLVF